jgi:hypothetical protein
LTGPHERRPDALYLFNPAGGLRRRGRLGFAESRRPVGYARQPRQRRQQPPGRVPAMALGRRQNARLRVEAERRLRRRGPLVCDQNRRPMADAGQLRPGHKHQRRREGRLVQVPPRRSRRYHVLRFRPAGRPGRLGPVAIYRQRIPHCRAGVVRPR